MTAPNVFSWLENILEATTTRTPNVFIQKESATAGIPIPDLPVFLAEHYGQCGEDMIVAALLRALAFRLELDLSAELYLEIGGNHPISTSATFLLHRIFGMRGVIVEANPMLLDNLRRGRPRDSIIHAAIHASDKDTATLSISNASELSSLDRRFVLEWDQGRLGERDLIEVPALRINDLLQREFKEKPPIFLSIDIEGLDLDVLRDLDFDRFRPIIIQAEPSDHHLPQNSVHMVEFLEAAGYCLIGKTEVNQIFLDSRLIGGKEHVQTLNNLQERVKRLHSRKIQLETDLRLQQAMLAIANGKIAETEHLLSAAELLKETLRKQKTTAELEVEKLWKRSGEYEGKLKFQNDSLVAAYARIDALENSTSWRIMSPLRRLKQMFTDLYTK